MDKPVLAHVLLISVMRQIVKTGIVAIEDFVNSHLCAASESAS